MNWLYITIDILFHPVDAFYLIKRNREKYSYLPAVILLVSVLAVRFVYIFNVHYPMATLNIWDSNFILEAAKLLLPVITWVVANYAVTTILEGETFVREILAASAYSMLPYIIITLFLTAFSQFIGKMDAGVFVVLQVIMWIWVGILFFTAVKSMNDFSFSKTVGICLMSVLVMFIIWAVLLLIYALSGQLYQFFKGILMEIRMQYLE